METSGNKYLHKKFKKQTTAYNKLSSLSSSNEDKNGSSRETASTSCATTQPPTTATPSSEDENSTSTNISLLLLNRDNNKAIGSVPNYKSTKNCDTSCSPFNSLREVNVIKQIDNQSSISKNVVVSVNVATTTSTIRNAVAVSEEPPRAVVDYFSYDQTTLSSMISVPSSCISKIITSTTNSNVNTTTSTSTNCTSNSLLGQESSVVRNFNFDTKSNISETSVETSSILDTVYSKCSLIISDRPNAATASTGSILKSDALVDEAANTNKTTATSDGAPEKKQNVSPEATTGNGKYVCTYCNLACSKPSVLQKHIRAHTNERPYPCLSCGFSFKTRSNLYKHCRSRTHANRVMGNKHVQHTGTEAMDAEGVADKQEIECADESPNTIEESQSNHHNHHHLQVDLKPQPQDIKDITDVSFDQKTMTEHKSKPYKPRFHTAKIFFEENKLKENDAKYDNSATTTTTIIKSPKLIEDPQNIKTNPDLIKLRINELINKNNSIVNCDDAVVIRRRNLDNFEGSGDYLPNQQWFQQPTEYRNVVVDEPLNLTAKNRKRCLSDSENTHKSLIKELLLKNLSADPNLQCKYCKMIFQTVTELEMHTMKYCNAKSSNIRYARSSSVNVASILTQNKNAFDNIPHMQHTTFPLKSPGPFLGNTRLIENDKPGEKYRTFSFDDNVIMHHSQSDAPSFNKFMLHSPVGMFPQTKKIPVKLFGGEVKITQTSGETRSFKIESESINKISEASQHFMEFSGSNLSENLVIKSTLQSGGTVLQNKSNYSPKMDGLSSPNVIRVYDNNDIVSPNLNLPMLNDKPKFNFDKIPHSPRPNDKLLSIANNDLMKRRFPVIEQNYIETSRRNMEIEKEKELYKSNLIDFGQKAVKRLAPNLKTPNLSIPGLPIPSTANDLISLEMSTNMEQQHVENMNFAKKQISLQQRMAEVSQPQHIYNPMNLIINGKVVRYVPGMPGPIAADHPNDLSSFSPINTNRLTPLTKSPKDYSASKSPTINVESREVKETCTTPTFISNNSQYERKTPTIIVNHHDNIRQQYESKPQPQIIQQTKSLQVLNERTRIEPSSPISSSVVIATVPEKTIPTPILNPNPNPITIPITKEESKKFVRPDSLALKPSSVTSKSHHGLTPTVFNQALISPDTPRVAKKYCQQYLNGNYFSYLGLKSSTKSVYCTLNKTQPFYVKHFKKLSMYSEWRQQESKIDSLSVSAYDSRQRQQKYTMAESAKTDLIAHSSYKFVNTESQTSKEESSNKNNSVLGGYESNEDYTYIRGRGRGRYVCDQCGIRCKKPSMLKKHIRTHSDIRPYTCEHCKFSFKTKGNLTKHMKSKAHSKKYAATSSTSTRNSSSVTTSSDSDESDAESSDESTRLQDHEAAHCLLSLSQKSTTQPISMSNCSQDSNSSASNAFSCSSTTVSNLNLTEFPSFLKDDKFLKNPDQISQVTNTNFAKNKILDESPVNFNATKHLTEVFDVAATTNNSHQASSSSNVSLYLGKSSTNRPLAYPYSQTQFEEKQNAENCETKNAESPFQEVIQQQRQPIIKQMDTATSGCGGQEIKLKKLEELKQNVNDFGGQNVEGNLPANFIFRKRKLCSSTSSNSGSGNKLQRNNEQTNCGTTKAVDLSVPVPSVSVLDLSPASVNGEPISFNGAFNNSSDNVRNKIPPRMFVSINNNENQNQRTDLLHQQQQQLVNNDNSRIVYNFVQKARHNSFSESNSSESFSQNSDNTNDRLIQENAVALEKQSNENENMFKSNVQMRSRTPEYVGDQDQSAMQTLAEIAISQVKLEKNILAKNVASEYLKLALNTDGSNTEENMKKFIVSSAKETSNDLLVKPEENKNCTICLKNFSKPSQLRLHMNIHYLERPFRCESCSVSFRTKGHLQKHERSAGHHNKLSSSPALSSSEPRPFKCSDCNIAFRIHGHLAKHLRSKLHIMKLECLAKIPFGLYAELERANSLLTEINTTDGDMCLESLKILAKKIFSNDPNKLDQLGNIPDTRDS